jgi:hypothetical protein
MAQVGQECADQRPVSSESSAIASLAGARVRRNAGAPHATTALPAGVRNRA